MNKNSKSYKIRNEICIRLYAISALLFICVVIFGILGSISWFSYSAVWCIISCILGIVIDPKWKAPDGGKIGPPGYPF